MVDAEDSQVLKQVLEMILAGHGPTERADRAALSDELAELQLLLTADGPLASAYELDLLLVLRAQVAQHRQPFD